MTTFQHADVKAAEEAFAASLTSVLDHSSWEKAEQNKATSCTVHSLASLHHEGIAGEAIYLLTNAHHLDGLICSPISYFGFRLLTRALWQRFANKSAHGPESGFFFVFGQALGVDAFCVIAVL